MARRVEAHTIEVGRKQDLEVAQGEDREFRLTFTSGGAPLSFADLQYCELTVRSRTNGLLNFKRKGAVYGDSGNGTLSFVIGQADTQTDAVQPYDVDVTYTDTGDFKTQLMAASTFLIDKGVDDPNDPASESPPSTIQWPTLRIFQASTTGPTGTDLSLVLDAGMAKTLSVDAYVAARSADDVDRFVAGIAADFFGDGAGGFTALGPVNGWRAPNWTTGASGWGVDLISPTGVPVVRVFGDPTRGVSWKVSVLVRREP
jgi:hypothetical protein